MEFPLRQNTGNKILWGLRKNPRGIFKKDDLGLEIAQIALSAALALTEDPISSLIDNAFIGHIGPVDLAGVGVAITVINQVKKVAIFPRVSVITLFVAEEDALESSRVDYQEIEIVETSIDSDVEKKN